MADPLSWARADDAPRSIVTIPSSDEAFATHVGSLYRKFPDWTAEELEQRLRKVFPRVVVRERSLSGEARAWYVYRDGSWRPQGTGPWWLQKGLPRISVSSEGWLVAASRTAADLLGVGEAADPPHHFTDFIVAGALEDALGLFDVVRGGRELEATILLRPTSGEVIAVDAHAMARGDNVDAVFRLADDVDIPAMPSGSAESPRLMFIPATDVAFRGYANRALERMPEPTPGGLELRLRRLYPHAYVAPDDDAWLVHRDRADDTASGTRWWLDTDVAQVRYDAQALILEANDAAVELFGRELVGHYWQEFVTPGSTEQVTVMLEILAEAGAAESRFRMPRPDGSLLEFDSYTEVSGDEFRTSFRPITA